MSTCTWLREIGLSTRELWQRQEIAVTSSVEWRNLCLERLGSPSTAPTMIQCQIDPNKPVSEVTDSLGVLKAYLGMAEDAYISFLLEFIVDNDQCDSDFDGAWHDDICYSSLTASSPQLKYLNISWNRFELEGKFLGGSSTTLTTLVLSHFDLITETWPQLPSLRNLLLDYNKTSTEGYRTESSWLLGWMQTLSSLEVLSIRCPSARLWNDLDDDQITIIPLCHLRIVRLEAHPDVVACILFSLSEPSVGLDITLATESEDKTSYYEAILRRLHHFWYDNFEVTTPASLYVEMYVPTTIDVVSARWEAGSISIQSHFGEEELDIGQRFCLFSGPYRPGCSLPFAVNVLRFRSPYILKTTNDANCFDAVLLDNINIHIVKWDLSKPYGHHDILRLEQWLNGRKDNGNPIRKLVICKQETEHATGWVEAMARNIKKSKIVEEVKAK